MEEEFVRLGESVLSVEEKHKLILGDCLEKMKEMPDNSIDLVLTDPPYKVSQMYGGGTDADNLSNVSSILRVFPEISRILKRDHFFVSFYDNRILPFLFEAVKGTDLIYRKSIYLYRRWGNANRWMGWMQCTDPICFFVNGHEKPFCPKGIKTKVRHDCYVKNSPEKENTNHPAQKPLELIKDIILWCSEKDNLILDPYMGSGTTALACKETKRNFVGIEINKEYLEMTKKRIGDWEKQTRL